MKPKWQKLAGLAQKKYARSSFSSLVQSLLSKDTHLRTSLRAMLSKVCFLTIQGSFI